MRSSCILGEDDDDEDDEDDEEEEDDEEVTEDDLIDEEQEVEEQEQQKEIEAWLKEHMISADAYDAKELLDSFLKEMELGLNNEDSSSLRMIPAYISAVSGKLPDGKKVAAIDAGGHNLRIYLASVDESGKIQLSDPPLYKHEMPAKKRYMSVPDFYKILVDALEPKKDEFDTVGFCFSYPAKITPDLDAELLYWTKEIRIPEMIGTKVGDGLAKALKQAGCGTKRVVMLNDTVATLLAGLSEGQAFGAKGYVGFILGTGTNTAYNEKNHNVGKIIGLGIDENGEQVINVESGGFDKFDRGLHDPEPSSKEELKSFNIFEKVISGEYMGPLTLKLLKGAADANFLSQTGAEVVASMDELPTVNISNFFAGKTSSKDIGVLDNDAFTEDDKKVFKTVFDAIVKRASLLTAVNISAAVIKSGMGFEQEHPVCITIEGSTYYKTPGMEDEVQRLLAEILGPDGPFGRRYYRCIEVEDASVVGAAIAGLTAFGNDS